MKGILVVAHGSRAKETEDTLLLVLNMLKDKLPEAVIDHAFMAAGGRTIGEGIASLAAKGITEITIAPYFLFTGIHIKEYIPELVSECMKKYPGIKVDICETLGADIRLAEILADRIKDCELKQGSQ